MHDDTDRTSTDAERSGRPKSAGTARRVLLPAIVVAIGAAGAFATVNRGGVDEGVREGRLGTAPSPASASHDGMVSGAVWVANEDGASLSVIDAATNTVVTSVKGVEGPHNVQVSPDSRTVWAVSGHDSMAVMLDAGTLALHGVVPTGAAPAHVIVTLDGKTTYTTNGADGTVTAIDAATMKPLATIPVGEGPHGLRPSPDGRWIYVANVSGNTLSVIDTSANTKVADIEVGKAPAQVAFSPDGRFVYASINAEDALVKVDVQTREVVGRVMVGDGPIQTYVSPDNRYVLVANQGTKERPGTTVSVIDTTSFTVARTVETGQGAHGVVVDPSSRHAYVTNLYGNDVAVLDLNELRVVGRIPVGDKPNGISFSTVPVSEQAPVTIELPEGQGIGDQGHGGDGH